MKTYTQEQINPSLPGVILMSHGPFAVSLVETAQMLLGDIENLAALSLDPGDDLDEWRATFAAAYEALPAGTVILADLYGGTPFNQVMRYVLETGKPVSLMVGMSLPMLIEALQDRDSMSGAELADAAVEGAKMSTSRVDTEAFLSEADDEDDED